MSQSPQTFLLRGGIDLATPALAVKPGRARAAVNYEATEKGFARCGGYERFDGRPAPSDAFFDFVRYRDLVGAIAVGDTITGAVSGATAVVLAVVADPLIPGHDGYLASSTLILASSSIVLASAAPTGASDPRTGYLILHLTTGTFALGEALSVSGIIVATAASAQLRDQAPTLELTAQYQLMAANARRALIQKVPGYGPVRGVAILADRLYAWRNNVGETACKMFRETATGWAEVGLGHTIEFTAGTARVTEGQVITRGSASATVRRVIVRKGTWGGVPVTGGANVDFAEGALTLSDITGTFSAGVATTPGGSLTLSGPQEAIIIPPLTSTNAIVSDLHNFGDGERLYIATGVGRAYEWDGTYATPIVAPLSAALDKPLIARVYAEHLFLFYRRGSVIYSDIGDPLVFDAAAGGAGEFTLGSYPRDAVAGSASLSMICRGSITYMTGNSNDDFVRKQLTSDAGGWPRTMQSVGRPIYLDESGLRDLTADDTFVGFKMGVISRDTSPIFSSYKLAKTMPYCSLKCLSKNQYRAFYSDGTGITAFFGNTPAVPELTQFRLPAVMFCAVTDPVNETAPGFVGTERMFCGGVDGFVYQLDRGNSYDGEEIEAFLRLPFNLVDSPEHNKRFHSFVLEAEASSNATVWISSDFDYSGGERVASGIEEFEALGGGGYWDEANWDEFVWDGPTASQLTGRIDGVGQSCSLLVLSKSAVEEPHTLTSLLINWTARRYRR